jgi:hypothetical protein
MSFREKAAWINLAIILVFLTVYFGALITGRIAHGPGAFHYLLFCAAACAVLKAILTFAAVQTTSRDGRTPADEREVAIERRSEALGYNVLVWLVILLGIPMHLGHPPADLMNFALLDVVLSALVVVVAQLVMFRRGI